MREIVEKLKENREIELAKSILESSGYKVTKDSSSAYNKAKSEIKKIWDSMADDEKESSREFFHTADSSDIYQVYSDYAQDYDILPVEAEDILSSIMYEDTGRH